MLTSIIKDWAELLTWLACFFIGFGVLAKWMPCNPSQPIWRKGMLTDVIYCLVIPIFNRVARIFFLSITIFLFFRHTDLITLQGYMKHGYGPLSAMPIWWQAAFLLMISDILLYWFHRAFHEKKLWRYHAIHHSPAEVDWLSTFRFHPINTWFAFVLTDSIMLALGFSPMAIAVMANVNMIYSAMVHANLNWTFGPFKYLFASPVFHRWHHTSQEEGMNKNFAPTFPLIDVVFGTFYMPENRLPERFGVPGSDIPAGFLGQMAWPFKKQS